MIFIVDLEDVDSAGLVGADMLREDDRIVVFYTSAHREIDSDRAAEIERSGCECEAREVFSSKKKRPISDYFAEIAPTIESDPRIGVVGASIRAHNIATHWHQVFRKISGLVVCRSSIAACIASCSGDPRQDEAAAATEFVDFEAELAKVRRRELAERAACEASGRRITDKVRDAVEVAIETSSPRCAYTAMLRAFGAPSGAIAYRRLKELGFISASS